MKTPNQPPSCDLPKEFYSPKLKPCPFCNSQRIDNDNKSMCLCSYCGLWGPDNDADGRKWNSMPRISELVKLLWLADEVLSWGEKIIDTYNFPEDGLAMAHDFIKLQAYAAKLRKEMES